MWDNIDSLKNEQEEYIKNDSIGLMSLDAARQNKKTGGKDQTKIYEDSKRKLSKSVAELERKLQEEQKKNSIMINKV